MPPIHFVHANGFPSRSYQYLFELLHPYQINYTEQLAHKGYTLNNGWLPMINELTEELKARYSEPIIGLGHSLGGVLYYLIAQKHPELFKGIILLDPPLFSLPKRLPLFLANSLGISGKVIAPAKKSRTRKEWFESKEEALAYFKSKRFFDDFHPRCLQDYTEYGLAAEGGRYRLSFSPEVEYNIFRFTPYYLGSHQLQVPSHLLYSNQYDLIKKFDLDWLRKYSTIRQFTAVEGSHMFPFENPEGTAEAVKGVLASKAFANHHLTDSK